MLVCRYRKAEAQVGGGRRARHERVILVDQLQPLVELVVVNLNRVELIASSMVKTDKRDVLTLAR